MCSYAPSAAYMQSSATIPTRPCFSWDIRVPPWTDCRGDQDQFYRAVSLQNKFHDALPNNNSKKIPQALQGIVRQSQLFGRAQDIGSKVSEAELLSRQGALILAKAICKKDKLSELTNIAEEFSKVVQTKQGFNEKLKNFESRFDAQVCKLHHTCGKEVLPGAILVLMLMENSNIDNSQCVPILAPISPNDDRNDEEEEDEEDNNRLYVIGYEKTSSLTRSSDNPKGKLSTNGHFYSSSAIAKHKEEIIDRKKNSTCHACGKQERWKGDPECRMSDLNAISKKKTVSFS